MVINLDKVVEVSMVNRSPPVQKFMTLWHEYLDLHTAENILAFHAVMPRVGTASRPPSIDCLYLACNSMAKEMAQKIAVCPSAWWWHLLQTVRGYTARTANSLMDCFDYDAAKLSGQSTFDPVFWVVTTQFANTDDFLDCAECELGSDDDVVSVDKSVGGTPCPTSTFEFLENAKASLTSALDNPDLDLAANSHASAKSRATNFSSLTGNLFLRSITTANFALTHKQRALNLAQERKKTAELSHTTRTMED
jgi:hypothetical protein